MTTALWVFLAAVVGGFVGGVAAHQAGLRWGASRRVSREQTRSREDSGNDSQVRLIRGDIRSVKEAVDRVIDDLNFLSQRLGSGGTVSNPAPLKPRPTDQQMSTPWDGAGRRTEPSGPAPAVERRNPERREAAGTFAEAPRAPEAAPRHSGPPRNAINVEARDDRIVPSSSYPPEAWVAPTGPAAAHLWINPAVALNEHALRRLSTFFEWRGERDGAMYQTESPAVLRWDEGQRVGTVTQRGSARPL